MTKCPHFRVNYNQQLHAHHWGVGGGVQISKPTDLYARKQVQKTKRYYQLIISDSVNHLILHYVRNLVLTTDIHCRTFLLNI